MRVLVTGATGFLGYAVAALLVDPGHRVDGLTRSDTAALPAGVRRVRGDVTDAGTELRRRSGTVAAVRRYYWFPRPAPGGPGGDHAR